MLLINEGKNRKPTLPDVARLAGVSIATVSHVLNARRDTFIGDATRRRVLEAVKTLGYHPNILARGLRTKTTRTFGLIFPGMKNDYITGLVQAIYREARKKRFYVLFEPEENEEQEAQEAALNTMLDRAVDGLFIFWPYTQWHFTDREIFSPVVLIDSDTAPREGLRTDFVRVDRSAGIEEATAYLLNQGRKRICLVIPEVNDRVILERVEGWRRGYQRMGSIPSDDLIFRTGMPKEWEVEQGYAIGKDLLSKELDFDAVLASDDFLAIGIMEAMVSAGKSVPRDVAVVGFNNFHACQIPTPKVASVGFPVQEIAEKAVSLLIDRVETVRNPEPEPARTAWFPMTFVPRASCG